VSVMEIELINEGERTRAKIVYLAAGLQSAEKADLAEELQ